MPSGRSLRGGMGIYAQRKGVGLGALYSRKGLTHGEGCGFRAIPGADLGVNISDVALHGAIA